MASPVKLVRIRAGTQLMRIHARSRDALWFGPARGDLPVHRFDDPLGRFRVCYLGTTRDVCFAETFLRNPPVRILAMGDLQNRMVATVELKRDLRLVPLYGPGLARAGVPAEVASGSNYGASQTWSRRFWKYSSKPDGIVYRSRHDDSGLCLALYDRARRALELVEDHPMTEDLQWLARVLKRYALALTR